MSHVSPIQVQALADELRRHSDKNFSNYVLDVFCMVLKQEFHSYLGCPLSVKTCCQQSSSMT